ncbi:hypothetical protein KUL49_27560 [Alteromonas sp. KUL49]|nr:hypothetical protein KUL49_27560 [Alteromonas sp. KUL49]
MSLVESLKSAQKDAMRAKEKTKLGTIRMALAAIKQKKSMSKLPSTTLRY